MTALPPNKRRYEKNRQAILDAAQAIIAEQGVEGLSMRALAEQVDYSPSALYKYFGDKGEILDALRQESWRMMEAFAQQRQPPPAAQDPVAALMHSGLGIYEFARQHPALYQLTVLESPSSPKTLEAFMDDPAFIGLRLHIAASAESGQLRLPEGFTADLLAFQLWFTVHGAALLRQSMMHPFGAAFDALVHELVQAVGRQLSPG
jgi:AcrR family transcriptional regulator